MRDNYNSLHTKEIYNARQKSLAHLDQTAQRYVDKVLLMVLQTLAMIVKEEKNMKRVMDLLLPLINITINKIKKLTNVSVPIDYSDATTKKFVVDLLKTKAGTNYVNNELAKNGNSTTLNNYALETDLQTLASKVGGA